MRNRCSRFFDRFVGLSTVTIIVGIFISLAGLGTSPVEAQNRPLEFNETLGTISVGGHVNTLATSLDRDFRGGNSADTGAVDINSVELGLKASPLKAVDASVVWLREEELDNGNPGDGFAVDQAYVTIAGNNRVLSSRDKRADFDVSPWYMKAGKMYSPFGTQMEYHTFDVVSEPQTLALSETLESSFMVGYAPSQRWNVYAGAFSGDGADSEDGSTGDEDLDDVVAGLDFNHRNGSFSGQWTNNINNSIELTGQLGNGADANDGISLYGRLGGGALTLQAAHVMSTDDYDRGTLADSQPRATSVELTYSGFGTIMDRSVSGTVVYEQTDEWDGHPEDVWGAVLDVPVYRGVTGSLEYINRDYDRDFSSRLDDEQLISFQLSVEFENMLAGGSP